jgi:hypothetical protein
MTCVLDGYQAGPLQLESEHSTAARLAADASHHATTQLLLRFADNMASHL